MTDMALLAHAAHAVQLVKDAEQARNTALEARRKVAQELRDGGMTYAALGVVLGLQTARVPQILNGNAPPKKKRTPVKKPKAIPQKIDWEAFLPPRGYFEL